jgi:hypothetical protein
MKRNPITAVAIAACLALSLGAFAQSQGAPGDYAYRDNDFYVNVGGQILSIDSSTEVKGGVNHEGTNIDVDRDLGLSSNENTWRIDAGWRFFHRHQLEFTYFQVNRSADKTLQRNFVYNGYDYYVGATVNTNFDSNYWGLKYDYYFLQGPRGELGAYIGLLYTDVTLKLKLDAQASGGGGQAYVGQTVERSLGAPTGTIGLTGTYQFTPKCFLRGNIGWLRLNINSVTGTVWDVRATVDYFPWKNVGFGGGYQYYSLKLDANKDRWDGYFKNNLSSFVGYVSFKF